MKNLKKTNIRSVLINVINLFATVSPMKEFSKVAVLYLSEIEERFWRANVYISFAETLL